MERLTQALGAATLSLLALSCGTPPGAPEPAPETVDPAPVARTDIATLVDETPEMVGLAELAELGPIGFLDLLEELGSGYVTTWDTRSGALEGLGSDGSVRAFGIDEWVTDDDLRLLLERLDDATPAAGIVSARSSMLPLHDASSTVGRGAAFLIEAARTGYFPPTLSTYHYFRYDPRELRTWAENRLARAPGSSGS